MRQKSGENPVPGHHLNISLDYNIQKFAAQVADKVLEQKQAKGVSIILMNPQNGEIYALVNTPEFDLNEPYESEPRTGRRTKL